VEFADKNGTSDPASPLEELLSRNRAVRMRRRSARRRSSGNMLSRGSRKMPQMPTWHLMNGHTEVAQINRTPRPRTVHVTTGDGELAQSRERSLCTFG
jgi:hypothetical protein